MESPLIEQLVTVGDHDVVLETNDKDIITDVIVLARVMRMGDPPGSSGLAVGLSEGVDDIVHRGMLDLAGAMLEWGGDCDCEDCEEE